jgi:glycosyl transferase, family 25
MGQSRVFGLTDAEIIGAVDGQTLDLEMMRSQGILQRDIHVNRDLTAGEIGCYLSHVAAWRKILEQKLETALICEDDIVWRVDANDVVDQFMAEVPEDWDILHFHSNISVGSGERNDPGRRQVSEHVWQGFNEGEGAVCYAITARGAAFLLSIAFPICSAVDGRTNWMTGWWKRCKGYRGYVCSPFPCDTGNFPSEIDAVTKRAKGPDQE